MKRYVRELLKNKGSSIIPCVFSILIIMISLSILYTKSLTKTSGKNTDEVLMDIFIQNVFSEIEYTKKPPETVSFMCCNDSFYMNNQGDLISFSHLNNSIEMKCYYTKDKNGYMTITRKEYESE